MKNFKQYKRVHMVGIKGVGMAALAEVLVKNGFEVSGSDVKEGFMTDATLKRLNISVSEFNADNIKSADALIRSNAYNSNNVEVKGAEDFGKPIFSYPEVVAEFFNGAYGLAVAGSHGKTTTTAMLAYILKSAGKNVTAIVGSIVDDWGSGAVAGDLNNPDALFVLEADEYKEAFLNYQSRAAIITNIDYDHPDYYKSVAEYENAFVKFISSVSSDGFLVIDSRDARLNDIARDARTRVISVGSNDVPRFTLRLAGEHNLSNAALAYRAALELGVSDAEARKALANFKGTARRMELVGEKNGALIYDDYAHHPTEIKATLAALRAKHPNKKIIAVFQPHTYSRTKALFNDFATAFGSADEVVLTDIYASAREQKDDSVDMAKMASAASRDGAKVSFIKDKNNIADHIKGVMNSDSLIVTMGAGDIWQIGRSLCA